jgi:hypothetical protein
LHTILGAAFGRSPLSGEAFAGARR